MDDAERPVAALESRADRPLLVRRSNVPEGLDYKEYRQHLRHDFVYSCAYCTVTESEAKTIRFTIDHYEPRNARRDLVNEYTNLMYACDECNLRKGDQCPPEDARSEGYRFFRPDADHHTDHFQLDHDRVGPRTNTGSYSIEALDLNRLALRKLRELRRRLTACDRYVASGIGALRSFQLDELPRDIKAGAARAIEEAVHAAEMTADRVDTLLRSYAKSELADPDTEKEVRSQERAKALTSMKALFPGDWRAPRKKVSRRKKGSPKGSRPKRK